MLTIAMEIRRRHRGVVEIIVFQQNPSMTEIATRLKSGLPRAYP